MRDCAGPVGGTQENIFKNNFSCGNGATLSTFDQANRPGEQVMNTVAIQTSVKTSSETSMSSEKIAVLREFWREQKRKQLAIRVANGYVPRPVGRPRKPLPVITEVCTQVMVSQEQQPSL
jgi:hypothetical protein